MAGYGCGGGPSAEEAPGRAGFSPVQVLRQPPLQAQLATMPTYEQAAGKEPPSSCAFSRCPTLGVAPLGESWHVALLAADFLFDFITNLRDFSRPLSSPGIELTLIAGLQERNFR